MSSDFLDKSITELINPETGLLTSHEGMAHLTAGRVAHLSGSLHTGLTIKVDDTSRSAFRYSLPEPLPELITRHKAKTHEHTHEEDIGESVLQVRETLRGNEIARSPYKVNEGSSNQLPRVIEGLSVPEKKHRRIKSLPYGEKLVIKAACSSKQTKKVDQLFQKRQNTKETQTQILELFEKNPMLNHRRLMNKMKKMFDPIQEEGENQGVLLGLTMFLASTQPEEMIAILSSEDLKASIRKIETSAFKFFGDIRQSLAVLEEEHQLTGLQDSKIAYYNKLAYHIAKILITSSGKINTLLIDSLISYFTSEDEPHLNHEASLIQGLLLLKKSDVLKEKIESIAEREPTPLTPLEIIRIQCGLKAEDFPTANHTKVTLLTALLSHPRQGLQGSCFASYLSIALLSSHKIKTADDLLHMLEQGKLTRKMGRVKKDFPFLFRIGDGALHKPFKINKNAWIIEENRAKAPIEKSPGLIAAARYLGFKHSKKAVREAALSLTSKKEEIASITCMQILKQLADSSCSLPGREDSNRLHMLLKACYCFDAEVNNPLTRAFESCLADMAEASNEGMIKQPVIFSILDPLESFIDSLEDILETDKTELIAEVQQLLIDRIHLSYDLDIQRGSSPDHNTLSTGGFALHDTHCKNATEEWVQIDSPDKFKQFAGETLLSAQKSLERKNQPGGTGPISKEAAKYLRSDNFLKDALVSFYPEYETKPGLLVNWDSLPYTPWRILSGNIAPKVRDVYMGSEADDEAYHQFRVADPLSLMVLLIDLAKSIPVYGHLGYLDRKERKLPVFTDSHAFNLSFSHPCFREVVIRNALPIKWIKDHYLKVAKTLSEKKLSVSEIEELIANLLPKLREAGIDDSCLEPLQSEKQASLRFIRELCLHAAAQPASIKVSERLIDQAIWNALPKRIRTLFENEAIPFADTNWSFNHHDILLSFAPHPGTDKVAVFEMKDTGEIIRYIRPGVLLNEKLSIPKNPDILLPSAD